MDPRATPSQPGNPTRPRARTSARPPAVHRRPHDHGTSGEEVPQLGDPLAGVDRVADPCPARDNHQPVALRGREHVERELRRGAAQAVEDGTHPAGAPPMATTTFESVFQPSVEARDSTDSSVSARTTASTMVASIRESHAPRASAARA